MKPRDGQLPLDLPEPKTLAKRGDPVVSHLAAADLAADPDRLGRLQQEALDMVSATPGKTAMELANAHGLRDPRTINRRLVELERAGRLRRDVARPCGVTGRMAHPWRVA